MNSRVWVNSRQPQTLYLAQILMYMQGGIRLLIWMTLGVAGGELFGSRLLALVYLLLVVFGKLAGAFGIANEFRWGYRLALLAAAAPLALRVAAVIVDGSFRVLRADPISLMFDIALLALLVHPQSRSHQRLWFK